MFYGLIAVCLSNHLCLFYKPNFSYFYPKTSTQSLFTSRGAMPPPPINWRTKPKLNQQHTQGSSQSSGLGTSQQPSVTLVFLHCRTLEAIPTRQLLTRRTSTTPSFLNSSGSTAQLPLNP